MCRLAIIDEETSWAGGNVVFSGFEGSNIDVVEVTKEAAVEGWGIKGREDNEIEKGSGMRFLNHGGVESRSKRMV